MALKILKPEEIKNPTGGLVLEAPQPEDWIKGHPVLGASVDREILQADKDWTPFITEFELQRNSNFDAYNCVTQTAWNKIQCLAKRKYNNVLNFSKRYTAVKSGTIPGVGNSVRNVVECIRTMGGVDEQVWPSMTPEMTQDEFYKAIPKEIDSKESFKQMFEYNHEWLPVNYVGATIEQIVESGLPYSPVMVSIEGSYTFDEQGRLKYTGLPYSHEVLVVASKADHYLVLDSENPNGLMRVRRDYGFVGPKIGYLKKKSMILVKEDGSPAVYLLVPSGNYYAIADGDEVNGGDLLKTFSGTYANAAIKRVPMGTIDKKLVVGEVKTKKYNLFNIF